RRETHLLDQQGVAAARQLAAIELLIAHPRPRQRAAEKMHEKNADRIEIMGGKTIAAACRMRHHAFQRLVNRRLQHSWRLADRLAENDMLTVAVGIEEIARAYGAVGHARAVQIEQRAGDRGEDFLQNHAFGNRSLPVLINEAAARALK